MDHHLPPAQSRPRRSQLALARAGSDREEMDADDEACGAVCSVKPRGDRIALWVRDRSDNEKVNRIGRKLVALLEIGKEPGVLVEFSAHSSRGDTQEGLFSVNNAIQQVRTPTVSTFNAAAAGLPEAPHRFATPSPTAFASPASPSRQAFRPPPSPGADTSGSAQFGRLAGQAGSSGSAAMFGSLPQRRRWLWSTGPVARSWLGHRRQHVAQRLAQSQRGPEGGCRRSNHLAIQPQHKSNPTVKLLALQGRMMLPIPAPTNALFALFHPFFSSSQSSLARTAPSRPSLSLYRTLVVCSRCPQLMHWHLHTTLPGG
ncbi:hypothetical protein L1887_55507 [Cichorium endivia]|nr:hypothetical protein L1887_55507 [Cichorium endivia]